MNEKEFDSKIVTEISADTLRKLYDRLDDEATPHAVRVCKAAPCVKRVTIYCDAENVAYFNMSSQ